MRRDSGMKGGDGADGSPPSRSWIFAQYFLGRPLPNFAAKRAEAKRNRERLEWLATISDRHSRQLRTLRSQEIEARRKRQLLQWLATFSESDDRQLRALACREFEQREAERLIECLVNDLPIDISTDCGVQEAHWEQQPRVQKGQPGAGRWTKSGGGAGFAGLPGPSPPRPQTSSSRSAEYRRDSGTPDGPAELPGLRAPLLPDVMSRAIAGHSAAAHDSSLPQSPKPPDTIVRSSDLLAHAPPDAMPGVPPVHPPSPPTYPSLVAAAHAGDEPAEKISKPPDRKETADYAASERSASHDIKVHLPDADRGDWLSGARGEGAFRFNDSAQNQKAGLAGHEVRFHNQRIAKAGFPSEAYYEGDPEKASVEIQYVSGTKADGAAANQEMRLKRNEPTWQQPSEFRWNHAGEDGSKTMELVDKRFHDAVAHTGPGATPRAQRRAERNQQKQDRIDKDENERIE